MDIDYTVAALMFPAIPLMMTMYSNRFHTLSALIRQLHDKFTFEKKVPPELEKQLHVLNKRANFLKYVMGFSSFGFLFNMLTVLLLYLNLTFYARLSFALCCVCMIISIFLFLQEVRMSNEALKYHLSDMDSMKKDL
ncbi:DUF2721 domain-containing protein [Candidatus Pelagibacter communis]|uniref:DUF2721 domain-containing protein n=1 Tax=Pelagibacter ubique TaxID=198252 RepID=UPI00094D29ED|nr:DUF2721 domain-containing protein [Candidatus Pelagibacter ubique]